VAEAGWRLRRPGTRRDVVVRLSEGRQPFYASVCSITIRFTSCSTVLPDIHAILNHLVPTVGTYQESLPRCYCLPLRQSTSGFPVRHRQRSRSTCRTGRLPLPQLDRSQRRRPARSRRQACSCVLPSSSSATRSAPRSASSRAGRSTGYRTGGGEDAILEDSRPGGVALTAWT
jgi:hypothetical protein